mmetsp:Transcript_42793/g.71151  ORF Transcript_42793/g.71151 Transcript_42793/m.71151 type:complete len:207 (+) Transcript_42793:764-1384(+)
MKTGSVVSVWRMVWVSWAALPQRSVTVQVRMRVLGQTPLSALSEKVMSKRTPQGETAVAWPVAVGRTEVPHSTVLSSGTVRMGGCERVRVMVWSRVSLFPQPSRTVQVRMISEVVGQSRPVLRSVKETVGVWQSSIPVGVPVEAGAVEEPSEQSRVTSSGKKSKAGLVVSRILMDWVWRAALPQVSVMVQVRATEASQPVATSASV